MKNFINESGIENFREYGFCIIEDCLSSDQIARYREACDNILDHSSHEKKKLKSQADGVTRNKELWDLIISDKVMKTVRKIIDGPVLYTQHSDIHIDLGKGTFHRDSREKHFDPSYISSDETVLRVALYLDDLSHNRGGLLIIPKTHHEQTRIQHKELSLYNKIRRQMRKWNMNEIMPHFSIFSKIERIYPKSGSIIIFDQRVVHAGLPPKHLGSKKYSIFWSYGSKSIGTKQHIDFYRKKDGYLKEIPADLSSILSKNNILVY